MHSSYGNHVLQKGSSAEKKRKHGGSGCKEDQGALFTKDDV